jgi:hypothetical protein
MDRVAYLVAALIGAALFVIVGYFADAGTVGISFDFWIRRPMRYPILEWGLFGCLIGTGVFWLSRVR